MNVIRTLLAGMWFVLETMVLCFIAIAMSFFVRSGNPIHKIAVIWAKLILFFCRIRVTVNGLSNIEPAKSYIYMCNHQSNFDIAVLLAYLPVQFRWLAKAELFKIPIFGRSMRAAGYISIDRFNRPSAFDSIRVAAEKIKEGISVMIFPEGTRSLDGKIRPFKKGGFILAVDAGVPIVPIILHGTRAIMPKGRFWFQPGPVIMDIQKPIATAGYTRESKNELMEQVRTVICQVFEHSKRTMHDA
jgi:1-acyl-sn-glycerol-3-phosphate acyltransferase